MPKLNQHQIETQLGVQISKLSKKMNIVVKSELKNFIYPLQPEEKKQLEQLILAEGVREPLVIWAGKNILVDGHNRYDIIQKHGLENFDIVEKSFISIQEVKERMLSNQL